MGWEHSQKYSPEFSIVAAHRISLTCGTLCALRTLVLFGHIDKRRTVFQPRITQYFQLLYGPDPIVQLIQMPEVKARAGTHTTLKYWSLSCLCLQPATLVSVFSKSFCNNHVRVKLCMSELTNGNCFECMRPGAFSFYLHSAYTSFYLQISGLHEDLHQLTKAICLCRVACGHLSKNKNIWGFNSQASCPLRQVLI